VKSTLHGWLGALSFASALLVVIPALPAADQPRSADSLPTADGPLTIHPINHATLAFQWKDKTICVDPVGGSKAFQGLPRPDLILITDIHGDHLSKETVAELAGPQTKLVGPPAVVDQLPADLRSRATALANGQTHELLGIRVEAVPAYNLTADRLKFHVKGRGNGYVLALGDKRIYLSGDTEGIPEMLTLKNIDVAFVCMNLPYTMDVEQAARAVRAFKPRVVYPYHYRGSDLERFKELVGTDSGIEVRLRDWYPKQ
jgi:L-ascorbate metabolism protein UlaG (beta-lactamase superfamily)